jgi:hypothetical protein
LIVPLANVGINHPGVVIGQHRCDARAIFDGHAG